MKHLFIALLLDCFVREISSCHLREAQRGGVP